ncbi:MAG: hypothetical protein GY950_03180 [bacterium]|nr:hypothetical protein [bacterium]
MSAVRVIIIDKDEDRRNGLKRQIRKFGDQVVHSVTSRKQVFINKEDDRRSGQYNLSQEDDGGEFKKQWEKDLINVSDFDLIFLHVGRNSFNDSFYQIKCEGLTEKVIGYTGSDRPDEWYDNPNFLQMTPGRLAADSFRFKEFFEDWHFNEQYNKERFGVPWNFRKLVGEDFIYLPVILMLCQCYLTIYYESEEYETDDTVGRALDRMGWERLKNMLPGTGTSLLIGKHFRQEKKVGDAAWFRDFFKKDDVCRDTLTQGIKSEWGDHQEETPAAIIKLIDAVYDGDGSNYTPSTVAGAYLAAAEKIGG